MARRIRIPETAKLDIGNGDWLLVKKRLTAGESQEMLTAMIREGANGADKLDLPSIGINRVVAYLLDWGTFTDADGKPLVVRDQPSDVVRSVLKSLDVDDFGDVLKAVDAHMEAMEKEREAEKNAPAGESTASPLSLSAVS